MRVRLHVRVRVGALGGLPPSVFVWVLNVCVCVCVCVCARSARLPSPEAGSAAAAEAPRLTIWTSLTSGQRYLRRTARGGLRARMAPFASLASLALAGQIRTKTLPVNRSVKVKVEQGVKVVVKVAGGSPRHAGSA